MLSGLDQGMNAIRVTHPAIAATTRPPAPLHRFVLAWAVMIGGLVGFWCCRPWLGTRAFNFGQLAVLVATWKIASLLCLPPRRGRGSRLCGFWPIASGSACSRGSFSWASGPPPVPRFPRCPGSSLNAVTGAVLLWLVPRLLPAGTPWAIRFWIALVGFCFLFLFARFDF